MRSTSPEWLSPPPTKAMRRALLLANAIGLEPRVSIESEQRPSHAIYVTLALVAACLAALVTVT